MQLPSLDILRYCTPHIIRNTSPYWTLMSRADLIDPPVPIDEPAPPPNLFLVPYSYSHVVTRQPIHHRAPYVFAPPDRPPPATTLSTPSKPPTQALPLKVRIPQNAHRNPLQLLPPVPRIRPNVVMGRALHRGQRCFDPEPPRYLC
jgi:hypothetical protein